MCNNENKSLDFMNEFLDILNNSISKDGEDTKFEMVTYRDDKFYKITKDGEVECTEEGQEIVETDEQEIVEIDEHGISYTQEQLEVLDDKKYWLGLFKEIFSVIKSNLEAGTNNHYDKIIIETLKKSNLPENMQFSIAKDLAVACSEVTTDILERSVNSIRTELVAALHQKNRLNNKSERLDKECKEKSDNLKSLKENIKTLKAEIKDLEKEKRDKSLEVTSLNSLCQQKQIAIEELNDTLKNLLLGSIRDEYTELLNKKDIQLNDMRVSITDKSRELRDLKLENQELNSVIGELKDKIGNVKRECKELKKELDEVAYTEYLPSDDKLEEDNQIDNLDIPLDKQKYLGYITPYMTVETSDGKEFPISSDRCNLLFSVYEWVIIDGNGTIKYCTSNHHTDFFITTGHRLVYRNDINFCTVFENGICSKINIDGTLELGRIGIINEEGKLIYKYPRIRALTLNTLKAVNMTSRELVYMSKTGLIDVFTGETLDRPGKFTSNKMYLINPNGYIVSLNALPYLRSSFYKNYRNVIYSVDEHNWVDVATNKVVYGLELPSLLKHSLVKIDEFKNVISSDELLDNYDELEKKINEKCKRNNKCADSIDKVDVTSRVLVFTHPDQAKTYNKLGNELGIEFSVLDGFCSPTECERLLKDDTYDNVIINVSYISHDNMFRLKDFYGSNIIWTSSSASGTVNMLKGE